MIWARTVPGRRGRWYRQCGECRSTTRVQQARNGAAPLLVLAFAAVLEHDFSALVDDVLSGPVLVAVGVPGPRLVVLRDRIGDAMPLQSGLYVGCGSLERKFRHVERRGIEPVADAGEVWRGVLRRGDREWSGLAARSLAAYA